MVLMKAPADAAWRSFVGGASAPMLFGEIRGKFKAI
jgi:hypothetical protein